MNQNTQLLLGIVVLLIAGIAVVNIIGVPTAHETESSDVSGEFTTFNSAAEFQNYTQRQDPSAALIGMGTVRRAETVSSDVQTNAETVDAVSGDMTQASTTAQSSTSTREISTRQTNVQEQNVGEPDIVKVTPHATYYAQQHGQSGGVEPLPGPIGTPELGGATVQQVTVDDTTTTTAPKPRDRERPRVQQLANPNTGNVSVTGELNVTGELLRSETALVAYNNSVMTGYELQNNGARAEQAWENEINASHSVVTTRRVGSTAYVITRERTQSCPVHPVPEHGSITCSDVYHPATHVSDTDSVYTVFSVDMETGDIADELSFVGGSDTTTYMSEDTVYVSYEVIDFDVNDVIDIALDTENISRDDAAAADVREVKELDVSDEAKLAELQHVLEEHGYNDRAFTQQLRMNIQSYTEENRRDIFTSTIVSLDVSNGDITPSETGSVPGVPLNQFSFDEHGDELRVATTVTPSDQQGSKNDVYVLNDALEVTGSVQGMAEGQRIYGVRFMGDTGYVITYRQVDPLHVIDLSDGDDPEEVGAVKLPGFSEYLHQVGDGKLLGVGESDGGNGKVVLFNVSNASNPRVSDSLVVDEWSTAVSESHHAFMTDGELNHAYVPAGNSLYVVDYSNGTVTREGVVNLESSVKRTRMYSGELMAFSDTEIAVIDKPKYNVTETVALYD